MRLTGALLTIVVFAAGLVLVPPREAAAEDPPCGNTPRVENPQVDALPWAQELYDPENMITPFSLGTGITVAVLDSGVDGAHPQLQGKVLPGYDFFRNVAGGNVDCVPQGTGVASIIAAQDSSTGAGFTGLAPGATILPVRVSEKLQTAPSDDLLPPSVLAAGIDYAVAGAANVVAVSAVAYQDEPILLDAVNRAIDAGVVVVAAVGDGHEESRDHQGSSLFPAFPAAYDGVIGVGAVGRDGTRAPTSQIGAYVDVMAPGLDITAAGFGGHKDYNGTGIATGFVAATAALMLGRPGSDLLGLSGRERVRVLTERLFGTADGTPGEAPSLEYGHGLVDPARAMSEPMGASGPVELGSRRPPPRDLAAEQLAADRAAAEEKALLSTLILGGLGLAVLAAAFVIPRARRRKWRAGRERAAALANEDDKREEYLPGELLFRPAKDRNSAEPDKVDQS